MKIPTSALARWLRRRGTVTATFLLSVFAIYVGVIVAFKGLTFGIDRDEVHFWPTSVQFSASAIPSLQLLRSYNELSTPLPFYVFGQIERLTGRGLVLSRYFNLLLTLVTVLLIARVSGRFIVRSILAAIGLLMFPYFIGTATYTYTDTMAMLFAVLGVSLYLRQRLILSAIALALAIASRQYMVAFPAAIVLYEWLCRRSIGRPRVWIWPALAAATLGGWFLLFGGFGPETGIDTQRIATSHGMTLLPQNALYFLTCIGAYFCVVEAILFRRLPRFVMSPRILMIAGGVIVGLATLFCLFPPRQNIHHNQQTTMGYLDIALRSVFRDPPVPVEIGTQVTTATITLPPAGVRTVGRMCVYFVLVVLTVWRFARFGLDSFLVVLNAGLMTKSHIAWDKYALASIAVLWLLQALPRRRYLDCVGADGDKPIHGLAG
jgi:hypothetical protein